MERREIDFLFKAQNKQKDFIAFKAEIRKGLDIDGASFLKLPKEVEESLIADFAKTLTATSEYLKKPLPKVGLIHGWNEPLSGYAENHQIREIMANATVDDKYPKGIIKISPFYLKPEFTRRFNFSLKVEPENALHPFPFLLAHEDYHIWQFLNQYERVVRDCEAFAEGGLTAWKKTQTEIDANEFANYWIKNH